MGSPLIERLERARLAPSLLLKASLRVPFALLALLAMLATLLPQTLWACPMNGRLAPASRVCLDAMPVVNGEMPCAGSESKCCKPLTLPASQGDDSQSAPAFTASNHAAASFTLALPIFEVAPFVAVSTQAPQAPAVRVYLARFTNSPPPFWTQFRPLSLAGRAPPLL